MKLYCTGCKKSVRTSLWEPNGSKAAHRYWSCVNCGSLIGCRDHTTIPLSKNIPTGELQRLNNHINVLLYQLQDILFMTKAQARTLLSKNIGRPYYSSETRSEKEAHRIMKIANILIKQSQAQIDSLKTPTPTGRMSSKRPEMQSLPVLKNIYLESGKHVIPKQEYAAIETRLAVAIAKAFNVPLTNKESK